MQAALDLSASSRCWSVQASTRRKNTLDGAFPTFAQAVTGVPQAAMTAKKLKRRIGPASPRAITMSEAATWVREVTAEKALHTQAAPLSGTRPC